MAIKIRNHWITVLNVTGLSVFFFVMMFFNSSSFSRFEGDELIIRMVLTLVMSFIIGASFSNGYYFIYEYTVSNVHNRLKIWLLSIVLAPVLFVIGLFSLIPSMIYEFCISIKHNKSYRIYFDSIWKFMEIPDSLLDQIANIKIRKKATLIERILYFIKWIFIDVYVILFILLFIKLNEVDFELYSLLFLLLIMYLGYLFWRMVYHKITIYIVKLFVQPMWKQQEGYHSTMLLDYLIGEKSINRQVGEYLLFQSLALEDNTARMNTLLARKNKYLKQSKKILTNVE